MHPSYHIPAKFLKLERNVLSAVFIPSCREAYGCDEYQGDITITGVMIWK